MVVWFGIAFGLMNVFVFLFFRERKERKRFEKNCYAGNETNSRLVGEKKAYEVKLAEEQALVADCRKQIRELNHRNKELLKECGEKGVTIGNLENSLTDARNNIETIDDARRTLLGKNKILTQEIEQLKGDISKLNKRIDGYLKECGQKGLEIAELKKENTELMREIGQKGIRIGDLKTEREELKQEIDNLYTENKSQADFSNRQTEKVADLEVQTRDLKKNLGEMRGDRDRCLEETKKLKEKVDYLDKENEGLAERVTQQTNRAEQLKEEKDKAVADCERMNKQLQDCTDIRFKNVKRYESEKGVLKNRVEALEIERNQARNEAQLFKQYRAENRELKKKVHHQGSRLGGYVRGEKWKETRILELEGQVSHLLAQIKEKAGEKE